MNLEMYDMIINTGMIKQSKTDSYILMCYKTFVAKRIESKPHPQDPRCLDFMAE
jgi:hypothetical protein